MLKEKKKKKKKKKKKNKKEKENREKKSTKCKAAGSFFTSIESSRSKWRLYFSCRIGCGNYPLLVWCANFVPFP